MIDIKYKSIDFVMESNSSIIQKLSDVPDDLDVLSYISRQLIINQKSVSAFNSIYSRIKLLINDENFIRRNVSILSLALISNNINYYKIIIDYLDNIPYETKKEIYQQSLQNNCNNLDKERLKLFLDVVIDVSFKNNLVYYLMKNNQNSNIDLIRSRPEVIHTAFEICPDPDITYKIDKSLFYKKYPEMLL